MTQGIPFALVALCIGLVAGCSSSPDENLLPVQCLDKPDPGPCKAGQPRFYYDYPSDTCRIFRYGGCRGRVPFETRDACEDACVVGRR